MTDQPSPPATDIVERLLDIKNRWGTHQDRRDGAAEILHLREQVARDDEHYQIVRGMSEKHRRLWVEAAQERDILKAEIERLRATPAPEVVEAARIIVAFDSIPPLADGPVDTPERHDELDAWFKARRAAIEAQSYVVEIAEALVALVDARSSPPRSSG